MPATLIYLPHQANSGPRHIWNTVYPDKYGHFEDKFAKVEAYSKIAKHIQNLCNSCIFRTLGYSEHIKNQWHQKQVNNLSSSILQKSLWDINVYAQRSTLNLIRFWKHLCLRNCFWSYVLHNVYRVLMLTQCKINLSIETLKY